MDKILVIQIVIISAIFLIMSIVALFAIMRLNGRLKKDEKLLKPKNKLFKRKDSNIYDIKASRVKR